MLNHWMVVPVFVVGFLLLNLLIGILASRRVRSTEDHVVGGRKLGFFLVFFVGIGETYSSVAFLGQPGWAYEHGVEILANVGIFIGLVAFWLGPKIWRAGREHNYITQAHFLGGRYQSETLRAMTSLVGVVAMVPYIAVQMMGGGYVFSVTTGGRMPFWLGALLAFGVVAIYVYSGGLRAISAVAVLKGSFMAVVGLYVVWRVVGQYYGSLPGMFRQLAQWSPQHLTLPGPKHFVTYTFHSTNLLNSLVAFYMWPHMFANFFAAGNARVIQRQAMFVPLYNIVALSFSLVGLAGVLVLHGIRPDTVMVEMLLRIAPMWLVALFCAGALSASMVTGAACSLAAGATIGNDLLQPRAKLRDQQLKRLIQMLTLGVMALAYGIALLQPALMVFIVMMAYSFTAQLFPGIVASFYVRDLRARAVIAGLCCGFATAVIFVFRVIEPPYNIHPGILGLAVNLLVMCTAGRATGKPKSQLVTVRERP